MTPVVGAAIAPFVVDPVAPAAMREWAVFLHDPNPIHLDADMVKAKGLGDRVINQGPANAAYFINMLALAFPGSTLEAIDVRFLDNVFGGERVVASGEVGAVEDRRVTCTLTLTPDGRPPVLAGTATIRLP